MLDGPLAYSAWICKLDCQASAVEGSYRSLLIASDDLERHVFVYKDELWVSVRNDQ
jgi:hypothetical protein